MFMFVYSVLTIAVVGMFFQIVNALGMYFALQQNGAGMQMSRWHSMVYEFACDSTLLSSVGLSTTSTFNSPSTSVLAAIKQVPSNLDGSSTGIYKGLDTWGTMIFTGTYYGTASQRMVLTYVTPTGNYGGLRGREVGRQLRRIIKSGVFTSAVYSLSGTGAVDLTVYSTTSGTPVTATGTISGFPLATVPVGSNVIISLANCT